MDLVCIGEILVDFTPGAEEGSYIANPGGAPANVAVAAARNGLTAGFAGKVGDDHFGRMLADMLIAEGVAFLTPEPTPHAVTTMAFVSLDARGERSFTFARKPGADMLLEPGDIDFGVLDSARMVHAGSCSLSAEPARSATVSALRRARELGRMTSFDVNYREAMWGGDAAACAAAVREMLPLIDLLKVSDEEAWIFGGIEPFLDACFAAGVSVLAETRGGEGALLHRRALPNLAASGLDVPVRDTTGAGDAFWGAFLSSLLLAGVSHSDCLTDDLLAEALASANAAGALSVQRSGGIPSLPTRAEILEMAKEGSYDELTERAASSPTSSSRP